MRKIILYLFLLSISFLWCGCEKDESYNERGNSQEVDFNPYIEGFTSGTLSRLGNINILFSINIPEDKQTPEILSKAFSIHPKVKGTLSVRNERELIFKPQNPFDRDRKYEISLNLAALFPAPHKESKFKFSVWTIKPEINIDVVGLNLDTDQSHDTVYEIVCDLKTSDLEDSAVVRKLLGFSEPVKLSWDREARSSQFRILVQPEKSATKEKKIDVFVKSNPAGYKSGKIGEIKIPPKNEFTVYDIKASSGNEEHVEVTFTRMLEPDQDFSGLVTVSPNDNTSFTVSGNRLKIWIADKNRTEHIIRIHDGIKASDGSSLQKNKTGNPEDFTKKISFTSNDPALSFIGSGGIIPLQGEAIVPFFATNIRGVIVRVIKIYENNMGQFLQVNNLEDDYELPRVGELLCRKIIFLDEMGHYRLSEKNAFALDLKTLIAPEPGAMYRVILSFNQDLSAYPCEDAERPSKQELLAKNAILEKEEMAQFGNGSAYYYFSDQSWNNYNWEQRNMPCKPAYYMNRQIGKNVLYTDLGIIAKYGDAGKMLVSVNNLSSALPEKDVTVEVFDYQNQLIEKRTTWENGTAEVTIPGKKPFYIIAKKNGQRGYLRLNPAQSLSMSTFDVSGEEVRKGIKGFIYTDRGVWRPGDTIHVSFILNDKDNKLPANHPVTLELSGPDNQLYSKKSFDRTLNNFYYFPVTTPANAKTGVWNCRISVGGVSFSKKLRIETIRPNRLEIDLHFDEKTLERNQPAKARLKAQWLTGAVADQLNYDITATFVLVKTEFEKYENFIFDDPSRTFNVENITFMKGKTNNEGIASVEKTFRLGGFAPGMLRAQFITKVYEESGEFSLNAEQIPYSPFSSYVGIQSPQAQREPLELDKEHTFDIATVGSAGTVAPNRKVEVFIYKTVWSWWWNADQANIADYVSSGYNKPVRTFKMETNAEGLGKFVLSFGEEDWGTYFIQARDTESGHSTGCMAYFDYTGENRMGEGGGDKATLLSFTTDKESYVPGENILVTFPSARDSRAIVCVEGSAGILAHHEIECKAGNTTFSLPATEQMEPNVYVSVTLLNPYASSLNELPLRMYGVVPIRVNGIDSKLTPVISAPESVRPNSVFDVTVSERKGLPMTYTVAIVDDGLLDLTRFKTPSPWNAFNAKEALSVRTWDMYNFVLGAYGGKIEQMFSIGGDDALNKGPKAIMNRFEPVVIFKGPFELKKGQKQNIRIDMPNYVGKVRCMVVAGNNNGYGSSDKGIFVRQPVMVLGTMPRVLAPEDIIWVPATVFAMEDNVGDVEVEITSSDEFEIMGSNRQNLSFGKQGNKVTWFKVKVKNGTGTGQISITARGKKQTSHWETAIEIQSPLSAVTKIENYTIPKGGSGTIELIPFGMEGSRSADIEVAGVQPLNIMKRMDYLQNYPYNCLEQTISRVYPYLYLTEIADFTPAENKKMVADVNRCLGLLPSYLVGGVGGFAYWPGETTVSGWGSAYAACFLLDAESKGYPLPTNMMKKITSYLSSIAREWNPPASPMLSSEEMTQAFRLYVLAKAGIAEKGAMNRLVGRENLNSSAKWMLALSFAEIGREDVAKTLIENVDRKGEDDSAWTATYGSSLRDRAVQLMVYTRLKMGKNALQLAEVIRKTLDSEEWLNTQATAFALSAMAQYYTWQPPVKELKFELKKDGKSYGIDQKKAFWNEPVAVGKNKVGLTVANQSAGTLFVRTLVTGIPSMEEQIAEENGITLNTRYTDSSGTPLNVHLLQQGINFYMDAVVTNTNALPVRDLMLVQPVPAGWEILNTRYLPGNDSIGLKNPGVSYQNFRDNKVLSYIPKLNPNEQVRVRIPVVASYAGNYFLPATNCEAMYDHHVRANSAGFRIEVVRQDE